MRLRPQNFPNIRIAQLANLYYSRKAGLADIISCDTLDLLREKFDTSVTSYWETHYSFGNESQKSEKRLSKNSVNIIIINTVIPILFAYGRQHDDEKLCDRAFRFLEELKAEDNNIIRMWRECGMKIETAADSQAIVQLKREYCDPRDCLRCRIGYEFIKANGWFVKDDRA